MLGALLSTLTVSLPARAGADPFIGEIMWVGYNFCPRGWTNADGQLLPIAQYSALFSLYGTTYGGDGLTTFGLPDLRGRVALHTGQGPGLTNRVLGQRGGTENEILDVQQLPAHKHEINVSANDATVRDGANAVLAAGTKGKKFKPKVQMYDVPGTSSASLAPESVSNTGGNEAHNNMQPYLTLRACVALQGIFPSRN